MHSIGTSLAQRSRPAPRASIARGPVVEVVGYEERGDAVRDETPGPREAQVAGRRIALDEPAERNRSVDFAAEESTRGSAEFEPKGPARQSLPPSQSQEHGFTAGRRGRQLLFSTGPPGFCIDSAQPGVERARVCTAQAVWVARGPGIEGVSAHAEPQHRLALPVAGVVPRVVPRARIARDLVPFIAGPSEPGLDVFDHVGGEILVAGAHPAPGESAPERGFGLESELVGRDVLRVEFQERVEITVERCQRLVGQREDQVEGQIVEAGGACGLQRLACDASAMCPAESFQLIVLEGLDPDREAIDSGGAKAGQSRELEGARVELQRGFGRGVRWVRARRTPRECRTDGSDQSLDRGGLEESRRPPPEVDRRQGSPREVRPAGGELAAERIDVAGFELGGQDPGGDDRKIAVGADPLAERQVQIDADPAVVDGRDPGRRGQGVGHGGRVPARGSQRASPHRLRYSHAALKPASTQRRTLPNGLTLLLRESHRDPVVELQIWAGVGSADERPGEEGLAHFHEHMLFKGTERRDVGEVAGEIEGLGGQINAYTSFDSTVYHATLPSAQWRRGLDVLCDAIRFSIFDEEEIAREREVVLEEIRRSEDTPGHVLSDMCFREAYRVHRYRQPILGPAHNVAGFDRAQVRRFFERWYTPDNLMVVAVGDFDAAEMTAEVERQFGDARPGQARRVRELEPARKEMAIAVLRKPFEGHRVDLAWPAAPFRERDAIHLDLLAYVLGECESSRLVQRVREEEGLVDRIDAGAFTPFDRGLFTIGYETDASRLLEATRRIIEETERLRRTAVTEGELRRARVNFLASEQFERESVSGVASKLGSFETMGGGYEREAWALEILRSATPADLLDVARRYLAPETLTLAALLPESSDPSLDEAAFRHAVERGIEAAAQPRATQDPEDDAVRASNRSRVDSAPSRLVFGPLRTTLDGAGERVDARLPNGLDLHILRRSEVPVVALRFACRGGVLYEDDSTNGITRFVSAMWTRGTRRRSAVDYTREVEGLAAEIEGFSGRNSIGLTLDCLAETLEPAFDLFTEALLEPRFEAGEIERERRETLAALDRREDRLGQIAFQLFARTEFQSHPYRMTVLGERASVSSFDPAALRRHADRLIRANRGALAVVGDVDPERVARLVEDRLSGLPPSELALPMPPTEARPIGIRESTLIKDRAQAHLVIGFRGLTLDDPDRHALELIAQMLAGQGGRLFVELRDRQSLAYTVSASNVEGLAPGHFTFYIATAPEKLERAREGILAEIERLTREEPDRESLDRAIRYGTGSFAINSQRNHSRAAHIALDSIYGLGADFTEGYPSALQQVTPAEILRVARRVFRTDAYTTSAVHP